MCSPSASPACTSAPSPSGTGPPMADDLPIVLAMTGASGAPYAVRLLQVLSRSGRTVHLTMSRSATQVIREEMGLDVPLSGFDPAAFSDLGPGRVVYHHHADF